MRLPGILLKRGKTGLNLHSPLPLILPFLDITLGVEEPSWNSEKTKHESESCMLWLSKQKARSLCPNSYHTPAASALNCIPPCFMLQRKIRTSYLWKYHCSKVFILFFTFHYILLSMKWLNKYNAGHINISQNRPTAKHLKCWIKQKKKCF